MGLFKPNIQRLKAKKNIKGLVNALMSKDKSTNEEAAQALLEIKDPGSIEPLIKVFETGESNVREEAALLLGKLGDTRAVDSLLDALRNKRNIWAITGARKALVELKNAISVHSWIEMLEDESKDVRTMAAHVLGRLGNPEAIEPLIQALWNKEALVRATAAKSLGEIADVRAEEPLQALLKAEEKMADTIASHLRQQKTSESKLIGIPSLQDFQQASAMQHEMHLQVQKAAKQALERIGKAEICKE